MEKVTSNINTKDIRNKLVELKLLLKEEEEISDYLDEKTDELAKKSVIEIMKTNNIVKPSAPEVPKNFNLNDSLIDVKGNTIVLKGIVIICVVLIIVPFIISYCTWRFDATPSPFSFGGIFFFSLFLMLFESPLLFFCIKGIIETIHDLNDSKMEYFERKNYMENEYPTKLKKYNQKIEEYTIAMNNYNSKFSELLGLEISKINEKKSMKSEQLDKINERIKTIGNIIPIKFYDELDELIDIFDDGRADTVKEAINVLISDQHANKMLSEKRRENALLQKKIDNEERARIKEARDREIERQDRGKHQCSMCEKRGTCYHTTHNDGTCRVYIPR